MGIVAFTQELKNTNDSQQRHICVSLQCFVRNEHAKAKPDQARQLCKPEVQTTEYLFGDDLSKQYQGPQ